MYKVPQEESSGNQTHHPTRLRSYPDLSVEGEETIHEIAGQRMHTASRVPMLKRSCHLIQDIHPVQGAHQQAAFL